MGWNNVTQQQDHPLWHSIQQGSRFYFVHSFYVESVNNPHVFATCDYGLEFAASLQKGNLFAVQFHPEKSADAGLQLLKNFCQWQTEA
jgi:glutamine amidotransferase